MRLGGQVYGAAAAAAVRYYCCYHLRLRCHKMSMAETAIVLVGYASPNRKTRKCNRAVKVERTQYIYLVRRHARIQPRRQTVLDKKKKSISVQTAQTKLVEMRTFCSCTYHSRNRLLLQQLRICYDCATLLRSKTVHHFPGARLRSSSLILEPSCKTS